MFYDRAKIYVKGGDGGNGIVAFRREKYVPRGGPAGGDGGGGGDVILLGDEGLHTLADLHYQTHYKAGRGEHGQGKNRHGAAGADRLLKVPLGTVVKDVATESILVDITRHGQQVIVAGGGRGGRGNTRFTSALNRAPRMAENGEPGEERWLTLELKLLADVGLLGFPNVGKSTLIAAVSAARPKIGDYPFTTVTPNLGVVRLGEGQSFVMADIPGLIPGAHTGAGLGHDFLRHIERTCLLIHVLDMAGSEGRDPLDDFAVINRELALFKPELAERPMVIAANKMDLPDATVNLARLKKTVGSRYPIFPVSAVTGQGLTPLLHHVYKLLTEVETGGGEEPSPEHLTVKVAAAAPDRFQVDRDGAGVFIVSGPEVERHLAMTNFANDEAVGRFQRILTTMGVDQALRELGAKHGDLVRIKQVEFDFFDPGRLPEEI